MSTEVVGTRPKRELFRCATGAQASQRGGRSDEVAGTRLERWLSQLVISPAFLVSVLFFYGLTLWVVLVSFTDSDGLIQYSWAGLRQYQRLWDDDLWRELWNLLRYLPIVVGVPMVLGWLRPEPATVWTLCAGPDAHRGKAGHCGHSGPCLKPLFRRKQGKPHLRPGGVT